MRQWCKKAAKRLKWQVQNKNHQKCIKWWPVCDDSDVSQTKKLSLGLVLKRGLFES